MSEKEQTSDATRAIYELRDWIKYKIEVDGVGPTTRIDELEKQLDQLRSELAARSHGDMATEQALRSEEARNALLEKRVAELERTMKAKEETLLDDLNDALWKLDGILHADKRVSDVPPGELVKATEEFLKAIEVARAWRNEDR